MDDLRPDLPPFPKLAKFGVATHTSKNGKFSAALPMYPTIRSVQTCLFWQTLFRQPALFFFSLPSPHGNGAPEGGGA